MARHWIFDLDGTLINSHPLYIDVFHQVAEHYKIEMTSEAKHDLCHLVLPKFLEKYFPAEHFESAFSMVIERNMARHHEIEIYPGLREVLDHLKAAGCVISLCTARERKTAVALIEQTGLNSYVREFVTRECVPRTKPHPEGLQRLIKSAQIAPEETLMVGDHRMDIEAARGAGIRAVSVGWNEFAPKDLSLFSDHHFNEVAHFQDWAVHIIQ